MAREKLKDTTSGWLFALSNNSCWGGPSALIKDFGLTQSKQNIIEVDTTAWGKLPKDRHIMPGEGIGFYHTTRADYGPVDKYKRKPRITMVGVLKNIEVLSYEGEMLYNMSITFEKDIAENLLNKPIIRNDVTKSIFEACRIVPANIRTWYNAPPQAWEQINRLCSS